MNTIDYGKLRQYLGWINSDIIKLTIGQTTQWGVALDSFPMKRHLKNRNPALDVPRRHESVATDTIFSDTPAVDSGAKEAQVFVGRDSLVAHVYPMKSGKQFVNTSWRTTSEEEEQWTNCEVIQPRQKYLREIQIFYGHNISPIGILNHTIKITMQLHGGREQ